MLVIVPSLSGDKIHSLFYHGDVNINQAIEHEKNQFRISMAREYLNTTEPYASLLYHELKLKQKVLKHLLVVIAKNKSQSLSVLSQLVTELDKNIRRENIPTALMVCNASRIDYEELADLARFYPILGAKNTTAWKLFNPEEIIKHDFVECLSLALNTSNAEQITIISDKVVPYKNFLYNLDYIASTKLNNYMYLGELYPRKSPWLYLNLHEPNHLTSFQLAFTSIYELLMIGLFGAFIFYITFRFLEPTGPYSTPSSRIIFSLFGFILFSTLALVHGRPYVTELRRWSATLYRVYESTEPSYFSGLSIPKSSAADLVGYLAPLRCSTYYPFHYVLDNAVNIIERPSYIVSPSLVRYAN